MTAYDDIPYSDAIVSFMNDGEIAGDNWTVKSWVEEEGKTVLATTTKENFAPYATAPKSFWKIEDGQFVKVHPESDITLYHNLQTQLMEKQKALAETNEVFEQYVDKEITDEQYEPTRLVRVGLKAEIRDIKSQIQSMEEK